MAEVARAKKLREAQKELDGALDEAKWVQNATCDPNGASADQILRTSLFVSFATFAPPGHVPGKPMRPRYTAPHPLEEEFVNSGLSEHAAAEAKKEEAKKAQERQEEERETLKTKAAEEARTLMERLKPEYLERLMEWRPGQPPPPGFDPPSKEEEPEGAPAMPVPREEAMKSPVVEAKRRQEEEKEEKYVPQVSLELGADVGEGEEELEEVLEEEEEHNDDDESD